MSKVEYAERLRDPRWQKKRLDILSRDDWKCQHCLSGDKPLHVHHIKYSGEPWETPDELLLSLCEPCHDALGEHPKGGVSWVHGGFTWVHCPMCGSEDLKDKGGYDRCCHCGHSIEPRDFPPSPYDAYLEVPENA